MLFFPVLLLLAGSLAAADLAPGALLLARARAHMSNVLSTLPNYTCLQTIERSQRLPPKKKPSLLDVIRIEVALVNGRELFAWPGSGHFSDTEISEMVKGGAIGTGSFALHAKSVFQTRVATFTDAGEEVWNGRKAHKWIFVVPQFQSGFTLKVGDREAIVGYEGAIWVDPENLDAVRLQVNALDIPSNLRLSHAFNAVEYARAKIGTEEYLLPSISELVMTAEDGSQNLNRTRFSACRQYTGESTLVFDDPPSTAASHEPARELNAPPGLRVDLALQSPVMLREAAVGDPVTAVLVNPLKLGKDLVIPKGALVHGRLTLLRPAYVQRYQAFAIGLKFFEIESANTRVHIASALDGIQSPNPMYISPGRSSWNLRVESETIFGSIIHVREYASQLERGLRMTWHTTPLEPEEQ